MLNRSTLDISANLSEILVDQGVKLVTKPGTLISELCKSIENVRSLRLSEGYLDIDSIKNDLEFSSRGSDVGEGANKSYAASEHDSYMDNYIEDLASLTSGYLNFSRNVVNKEVNKLVESTLSAVSNYKHREPEDFFEVEYYKIHDVFKTYTISEEISGYNSGSEKGSPERINLKSITEEDSQSLENYFLIGDGEEDLHISGWLSSLGGSVKHYLLDNVYEASLQINDQLNYYLVNYLFYRNLSNTPNINTGDSAATLKRKASFARDYYGTRLKGAIDLYHTQIKQGRIIVSNNRPVFSYFNEGTVKLCLFEETFGSLAEAGGGIETVLGYIVTGDCTVTISVNELIKDLAKYKNLWDKTRSLYMIHLNTKRLDIFKHTLRNCFESSIHKDSLTEAEQEFIKDSNFQTTTFSLANAYIDKLTIDEIEDLEKISLELVGKIRFRFTNAYTLLSRMRELMLMDETLTPMEAALYSTINYLTDYCLDQTNVVKG